ncbi:hypothetical protein [Leifsonia sp. NPDC058230]|uniref:hypothetical protein n=1 Tax=Leifsonia sp. NPDC058230 TaxID=3346391 RepID=UPI0036DBBB97
MNVSEAVTIRKATEVAAPSESDIKYGYLRGLLSPADCVSYFSQQMAEGAPLSGPAEQIALLLSDELEKFEVLARGLASPRGAESRRYWILVALVVASDQRPRSIENVEDAYEFFDSDESLLDFVPWIRPDFNIPSEEKLFRRLGSYIAGETEWAKSRPGAKADEAECRHE